jgi:hypothetical protein
MTEPQSNRASDPAPVPIRRDVYRETLVDETSASGDAAVVRDVSQERVSGPAGDQVIRSELSACRARPSAAAPGSLASRR